MATKPEILKELAALGVTEAESKIDGILPLKGDETGLVLSNILKKAKKAGSNSNNGSSNQSSAANTEGTVLVWVKGRTYINATQRIDGGLYRLSLPLPERLANAPLSVVEQFADGVPPRKLTELAKWSGISHPEDYNDDDLLAKITAKELKPF